MSIISSLGPLPGLLGLAIFPLLVTLPLGLISAELSTAFPTSGSKLRGATRLLAGGRRSSISLFLLCGRHGLCNLSNPLCRISIGRTFLAGIARRGMVHKVRLQSHLHSRGISRHDDRGQFAVLLSIASVYLSSCSFCLYPSHEGYLFRTSSNVSWEDLSVYVHTLLELFGGKVASFASEVERPRVTYPWQWALALCSSLSCTCFPHCSVRCVEDYRGFVDGEFVNFGEEVGIGWLIYISAISAALAFL